MISNAAIAGATGPPDPRLVGDEAQQQFLAPAPAGDDADIGLDQTDIGFCMGLDCGTVKGDFAASAESHAGDGGDARMSGEFQPPERLVAPRMQKASMAAKSPRSAASSIGFRLAPAEKAGPSLPITRAWKLFAVSLDCHFDAGHQIGVEGVHLGVEFETGDAVAQIPDRGGIIAGDWLGRQT